MGMRFSLKPWPRKRGEPALGVVVSLLGHGLSRLGKSSDGKVSVMSEVGMTSVGALGSVGRQNEIF